jgi:EAL domain-containing protein (putative c-di-GMP-specific phosphodiesterase class I)/GGDEF domain-containing protein
MQYNFYFDICALCILGTVAITSLSRRWVPAYRQRAYVMLFLTIFVATLSERIETYLQMNPVEAIWYHPLEMLCGSMYFIAHLGTGYCYLKYILAVLDIYVDTKRIKDLIGVMLGYYIGIALVVINLFVPILFSYGEDGLYHREDFIFLYYILAGYYVFYGIALLLKYKILMRLRTKAVVISYVLLVIAGMVIQYFWPTILIENFLGTIGVTLVYISLQNPTEMVDGNLNILNRKAFLEGLDLKTGRNSVHSTIFVTIDNIRALSDEIGYEQAQAVLKKIARYLKYVGKLEHRIQCYVYRYSEYVFAITVHTVDKNKLLALLNSISKRLQQSWAFSNMAIRVESHCFLMEYPEHYRTSSELISRLDLIVERAASDRNQIIDVNKPEYSELRKITDYDMLARHNLDTKSFVIRYQPILSKVYRINYSADVLCFLKDEYGNEIDMRGRIPDINATQALMDTDEMVYRRACRALAFWNAGDKNGKYRAVVGMSQGEISKNDFVRRIKKIAREEKAENSWITLKLTETTITTMNAVAERNLRLLGEQKCAIIVDDFGSGYGDMDKIMTLPVTQVNIAHDILVKAGESEKMKIVAKGMVNLFHDISIFVGAKDIANENDKQMAEELGCDFLIGDFMGSPMKDSSFVKYIDAYFEEG